jgi:hypothetical protein
VLCEEFLAKCVIVPVRAHKCSARGSWHFVQQQMPEAQAHATRDATAPLKAAALRGAPPPVAAAPLVRQDPLWSAAMAPSKASNWRIGSRPEVPDWVCSRYIHFPAAPRIRFKTHTQNIIEQAGSPSKAVITAIPNIAAEQHFWRHHCTSSRVA